MHAIPICAESLCTLRDCRNLTHKVSSQLQTLLCVGELLCEGNTWGSGWVKEGGAASQTLARLRIGGAGSLVEEVWVERA